MSGNANPFDNLRPIQSYGHVGTFPPFYGKIHSSVMSLGPNVPLTLLTSIQYNYEFKIISLSISSCYQDDKFNNL